MINVMESSRQDCALDHAPAPTICQKEHYVKSFAGPERAAGAAGLSRPCFSYLSCRPSWPSPQPRRPLWALSATITNEPAHCHRRNVRFGSV